MTTRSEKTKTERRRRNPDGLQGKRRRLAVNEAALDRENFEYRWVNDDGNRIHTLTVEDDWDVVTQTATTDSHAMGAGNQKRVGTGEQGVPVNAILLQKPKRYYDEDDAQKQRRIDASEQALKEKPTREGEYAPDGGVIIQRGT